MEPTELAKMIRSMRAETELTQAELAERAGVSAQTISNWQHGECLNTIASYHTAIEAMGYEWRVRRRKPAEDSSPPLD